MKIFRHTFSPGARTSMYVDMVLCFAAVLLAASTLTARYSTVIGAVPELPLVVFTACMFSLVMALMWAFLGMYRPTPVGMGPAVIRTTAALAVGGYITYLAMRVVADRGYAEQLVASAILYLGLGLLATRFGLAVMRAVTPMSRVLIIGDGPEAHAIARDLKTTSHVGRDVVGLYPTSDDAAERQASGTGPRVFGREATIPELVRRFDVQEVIVAVREQRGGGVPMDQLLACRIRGVPVLDIAGFCEKTRGEIPIDSLKGSWLVYGHGFEQGRLRTSIKRAFDIVSSLILLIVASPIMLLAMIAIKLDSRGPVLYRQERVGLGGVPFTCLKFRSMCADAESDGVARWAQKNDPRVTRCGAFMRKTRVDELPQLFSVLKGEMSLVGPRPERPDFVAKLKQDIPFYDIRHSVKPGVTGWAQVRYHYGATLEDAKRKHQFDLYYVRNNSLFLDVQILIETVSVVLFREGQ